MAPLSGLFRHLRTLDAALSAAAPSLNQAATKADLFVLAVPDEATLIQVYRLLYVYSLLSLYVPLVILTAACARCSVARTTPTQDLAAEQPSDSEDGDDNFDLDSSSSSDDEPLEFASDASSDGGSSDDSDDNDESTHHYISSDISATVDDTSETVSDA